MIVNFDTAIYADRRFFDLCLKLGSREAAIGALVLAWAAGQEFWKYSDNGIPKPEWHKQALQDAIIEVGLAEDKGDFVLVSGSSEHFAFIRSRSKGGQIGAKVTNQLRWNTASSDIPQEFCRLDSIADDDQLTALDNLSGHENNLSGQLHNTTAPNVRRKVKNSEPVREIIDESCRLPSSGRRPLSLSLKKGTNTSGRADLDARLNKLFELFPKRLGDNPRKPALEKLARLDEQTLCRVERGVQAYSKHILTNPPESRRMIPMFKTWLNQERWNEWQGEIGPARKKMIFDTDRQEWVEVANDAG